MNLYEIVGFSMGLHRDDDFKRLKIMQDADAILADCQDLVQEHGLDVASDAARSPSDARRAAGAAAWRHSLSRKRERVGVRQASSG